MIQLFEPTIQRKHYQAAVAASLRSKHIDNGAAAAVFEERIAARLGVPRSWVAVTNSCTAALTCAYHFLIGRGTLYAPAMTWPGSYVGHQGLVVFYDGEYRGGGDGAVLVDMYGTDQLRSQVDLLRRTQRTIPIIIDSAHNCFARYELGEYAALCYSFGPIKELSTIHGGCLISPRMTWEWRAFLHYGAVGRDSYMVQAGNYCMPDFNARLGLAQLPEFDNNRQARRNILGMYADRLGPLMLTTRTASGHVAIARFPTKEQRDLVRAYLTMRDIQTGHHYPMPRHQLPELFPASKALSDTVLTLPCHLGLTQGQVMDICNHIKEALKCVPTTA